MRKSLLLSAFAAFVLASPAQAQFCPGVSPWVFDDVLASDPFCGFVTWMAENGITLGCQTIDANHRLYCPADGVNRLQMAAFMKRLGDTRVEAVDTGPGLLGGPITSFGTITLAPTQLLPTTACTNGQVPRWNGSAWACATLAAGGSVVSVGSGTGLTGGPITTVGSLSILPGFQLPQRCASGQVAKSTGADAWRCADDTSGGTVTSVATGTGLSGGPITTAGTISVDTSVMQRRVTGTCQTGAAIRTIAADGSITCVQPPSTARTPWPAYTETENGLAATGQTNTLPSYVSVVIGSDGLPLIAFYDVTAADLKVLHCDDIACTKGTVATIDSGGDVGKFNAITLDTDGLGAISYYDATNGALKLARCQSVICSVTNNITTVDTTGNVGQYTSIATAANGRLVIAYYDATNHDLKLAYCNPDCSSPVINTIDSTGDVGKYASIAVAGTRVFVSYFDQTNTQLRLAVCSLALCDGPTLRTLDATAGSGLFTSIAIAQDESPIVSYVRVNNLADFSLGGQVRIAKCAASVTNTCPSSTGTLVVTTLSSVFTGTAITVGIDGIPMIAMALNGLYRCTSVDCAMTFNTKASHIPPSFGNLGTGPALTIGMDGMPLLVHSAFGELSVIHCGARQCSAWARAR